MKLFTAHRAPYPRRVQMFLQEKGIAGVEYVNVDLMKGAHKQPEFRALSPFARIPVLELDDGSVISESRAICSLLESMVPEPNLMGRTPREHALIEMSDRHMDFYWMAPIIGWIRNTLPNMGDLVGSQYPEYAQSQKAVVLETAAQLDERLQHQEWIAGERFTVADITAFCALEVARVVQFRAGEAGFGSLQAWRDRMANRDSARFE